MAQIKKSKNEMSFLEHLEDLRWHIIRSVVAILLVTIPCLFYKDFIFEKIVFFPKDENFPTYRLFCLLGDMLNLESICIRAIDYQLINGDLTLPFLLWLKTSFMLGVIAAFPYIIYEIWKFVRPALYEKEKKSLGGLVFSSIFLFYFGASFGYFVLAPFSINFLGNFSLGEEVSNVFTVTSFIEILTGMVLWSGVIFEIPMAAFFLARIGLLNKEFLAGNRKYAIVIALILAAIITPSGDVFSLSLVALPLWILYEVSIVVVKRVEQRTGETTS